MEESTDWTLLEEQVAAARRAYAPRWTPACLEPEALLDLIEREESHPETVRLPAHAAECPYCRRQYVQMRQDLLDAQHLREDSRESGSEALLASLSGRSPSFVTKVSEALQNRQLALPRPLLRRLNPGFAGNLQSGVTAGPHFKLLSPVGTCAASDFPTFRWEPLDGVRHYAVTVYDQDFDPVAQSGQLSVTWWTVSESLARDAVYTWDVVAVLDATGAEVYSPLPPAPNARFYVLPPEKDALLAQAVRDADGSHLGLAVAYGEAGLLEEAERELEALQASDPGSDVVRLLLSDLRAARDSEDLPW